MAKDAGGTYGSNKGEIASPNTDAVVDSLKEANSPTKVNHNVHDLSGPSGGGTISTPATDGIAKKSI